MPAGRYTAYDQAVSGYGGWSVNGEELEDEAVEHLDNLCSTSDYSGWGRAQCHYCAVPLQRAEFRDVDWETDEWRYNRGYVLSSCDNCAYWEFQCHEGGNRCMDAELVAMAAAIAARFATELPEGCASELAQHLRQRPASWHTLSPDAFERLVADVFRANHQGCEVIHVGKPGDRGIDVIFVDDNETTWLIQAKRRSCPGSAEGFSTLQSILGTLALEGKRHGVIATTADHFSYQARKERARAKQHGFVVELMDRGVLERLLGPLLPQDPWRDFLSQPAFANLGQDVRDFFDERLGRNR